MTTWDHDSVTELIDPVLVQARSRIGRVLREKWRLDVLLGVGGMAAVYAATHRNGSRVAIKILHAEVSTNPLVRQRFLREGYVANSVAHDGAVKVSDDDVDADGSAFLVMELLDGETLEERRLRFDGRLSEDEVLTLTHHLLDVLAAAHAKGIVHRDLKPENIFLTRTTGQVKVHGVGTRRARRPEHPFRRALAKTSRRRALRPILTRRLGHPAQENVGHRRARLRPLRRQTYAPSSPTPTPSQKFSPRSGARAIRRWPLRGPSRACALPPRRRRPLSTEPPRAVHFHCVLAAADQLPGRLLARQPGQAENPERTPDARDVVLRSF